MGCACAASGGQGGVGWRTSSSAISHIKLPAGWLSRWLRLRNPLHRPKPHPHLFLTSCDTQAKELSIMALERLSALNRRTLDGIAARIYFYYTWAHEQTGQLADVRRCGW